MSQGYGTRRQLRQDESRFRRIGHSGTCRPNIDRRPAQKYVQGHRAEVQVGGESVAETARQPIPARERVPMGKTLCCADCSESGGESALRKLLLFRSHRFLEGCGPQNRIIFYIGGVR